jgi:hypothetical protein
MKLLLKCFINVEKKGRAVLMIKTTFQRALEIIESFSEEDRESLIQIVKSRLIEERRDRLAQSIKGAKQEYERGTIIRGSVDDLMREISE